MTKETALRSYEPVAWFYETLAHVYSFGLIRAAKASQLEELSPGQRILYVGVGSGEDAVLMAKSGVRVTCLDLSPSMLERTRRRFAAVHAEGEFICGDVMEHHPAEPYAAVAANFFLNVFPEPVMKDILGHLVTLVRPGGLVMIADFAPAQGNALVRTVQRIHFGIAVTFFWLLGLSALHPIYDYSTYAAALGLEVKQFRDFGISMIGLRGYRSLIATRPD